MILKETGIVTEVTEKNVKARVKRTTACGENCGSCGGACTATYIDVLALNKACAKTGDRVEIEIANKKVLSVAFLVYIMPLICLIIGDIIGNYLFSNELLSILSGIVFMAVSFFLVKIVDRKSADNYTLIVTKIL